MLLAPLEVLRLTLDSSYMAFVSPTVSLSSPTLSILPWTASVCAFLLELRMLLNCSIFPSAQSLYGFRSAPPTAKAKTAKDPRTMTSSLTTNSSLEMAAAVSPVPRVTQPVLLTSELPCRSLEFSELAAATEVLQTHRKRLDQSIRLVLRIL